MPRRRTTTRRQIRRMKVVVAKLGEDSKVVRLPEGASVADAIKEAGFSAEGTTIHMNNEEVTLTAPVMNNSVITLTPEVKGGL